MRVRKLDANGDMTFGQSAFNYFHNSGYGVGQIISTRLRLWQGQWFLDPAAGTPWTTQILGKYTESLRDLAIQDQIYGAPGVLNIEGYNSQLDVQPRAWTVHATVNTIYGPVTIAGPI